MYLQLDPDHIVMTGRKTGLMSCLVHGEEYVVQECQEKENCSCHLLISCHQVEPDELGAVDWPSVVPSL